MTFQLSDRAKELIPKARIVSFAPLRDQLPPALLARLQAADDAGRYLNDEDLTAMAAQAEQAGADAGAKAASALEVARCLRDQADEIVTQARQQVLHLHPGIAAPGGALYPALRAEACWRDFWHFLRCISYGIASNNRAFTSPEGLHHMNLLYQEMKVPLPAMVTGLEALKVEGLQRLSPEGAERAALYFDHLIGQMRTFKAGL